MMQDPNPLPWGAQDRFQAHFVVQQEIGNDIESWRLRRVARTRLKTTGHFGSKKIIGVTWEGGKLAEDLNTDSALNEMIVNQSVNDATIFVDPRIMEYVFMENGKIVWILELQRSYLRFITRLQVT